MRIEPTLRQTRKPSIHKKADGFLLIYPDSRARFLGFWDSVKHRLFGWTAQDFIDEETDAELFRVYLKGAP